MLREMSEGTNIAIDEQTQSGIFMVISVIRRWLLNETWPRSLYQRAKEWSASFCRCISAWTHADMAKWYLSEYKWSLGIMRDFKAIKTVLPSKAPEGLYEFLWWTG